MARNKSRTQGAGKITETMRVTRSSTSTARPPKTYIDLTSDDELEAEMDELMQDDDTRNGRGHGRYPATRSKAPRRSAAKANIVDFIIDDDEEGEDDWSGNNHRNHRNNRSGASRPSVAKATSRSRVIDDEESEDDMIGINRRKKRKTRSREHPQSAPQKRKRGNDTDGSDHEPSSRPRKVSKHSSPKKLPSLKKQSSLPAHETLETLKHKIGDGKVFRKEIPYHVWYSIFEYASLPLSEEHPSQRYSSSQWLLQTAKAHTQFKEPALSVLYASLPLLSMGQAQKLVELFEMNPQHTAIEYRRKVKSLKIDVGQVLMYKSWKQQILYDLIKNLMCLKNLEFYHQMDMPPYRELDTAIKWTYPESVFKALEYVDPAANPGYEKASICHPTSWRWSARLAGEEWAIELLPHIHQNPVFAALKKIAFVNYHAPVVDEGAEDPGHELALAASVKALPNLRHLIFESSTLINAELMPLLPRNLQHLELTNCWAMKSEELSSFLLTHGQHLQSLTLKHNQSLDLGFLTVLGEGCPKLEHLNVNLTLFNVHATYRDAEPWYEQLLLPEQIPSWPSTLQTIELLQLRKWTTEAAEILFQSLLDSAGDLLDLRRLSIQAILNIPWRDRSSFRHKWEQDLFRVFKRVSAPPKKWRRSIPIVELESSIPDSMEDVQESIEQDEPVEKIVKVMKKTSLPRDQDPDSDDEPITKRPRRSKRSAAAPVAGRYAESPEIISEDESDGEGYVDGADAAEITLPRERQGSSKPRLTGLDRELEVLRQTAGKLSPELSTSQGSGDDSDEGAPKKPKVKGPQVIQGMCDIVEVRIDNLRPTENQVTEADFLDEERSGDEDWNENDSVAGDGAGEELAWT